MLIIEYIKRFLYKLLSPSFFPIFSLFSILIISGAAITALLANDTLVIQKEGITLHSRSATNAEIIQPIAKGQPVVILSEAEGWLKIRVDNYHEGWIPKWLIDNEQLENDQHLLAVITKSTALYEATDLASNILITATADQTYEVLFEDSGWLKLKVGDHFAYVPTKQVALKHQSQDKEVISTDDISLANKKEKVQIRLAGQALFSEASTDSEIIYMVDYYQDFTYIETVTDAQGNDFYSVVDANGTKGFVESRAAALESESANHINEKTKQKISDATILIDPGHGGIDSGAIIDGTDTYEKNLALDTSKRLKAALEGMGATVLMTRDSDMDVSLSDRAKMSNTEEVDMFISVHYDKNEVREVNGTTMYYFHAADLSLAEAVNEPLKTLKNYKGNAFNNNGVRFGNFQVLRENNRPSILIETGYLSNEEDIKTVTTETYRQAAAEALAQGIKNYFESTSPTE